MRPTRMPSLPGLRFDMDGPTAVNKTEKNTDSEKQYRGSPNQPASIPGIINLVKYLLTTLGERTLRPELQDGFRLALVEHSRFDRWFH